MTCPPMRSERPNVQRVIFNEPWCNDVDLGAIVQESNASIPIDSYSGYVLNPVPSVKGVRFQKGVCIQHFMPWVSWVTFGMVTFPFFPQPSLVLSPLSGLNVSRFWILSPAGNCG